MTDPQNTGDQDRPGITPFKDIETAIQRDTAIIAERFPDTDPPVQPTHVR